MKNDTFWEGFRVSLYTPGSQMLSGHKAGYQIYEQLKDITEICVTFKQMTFRHNLGGRIRKAILTTLYIAGG